MPFEIKILSLSRFAQSKLYKQFFCFLFFAVNRKSMGYTLKNFTIGSKDMSLHRWHNPQLHV
ncbi:MAG: hypothetical protein LBL94_02265, partial [Prevotellaceae bacterium]|nr:hypothetical protein [Prevotellaceae bacterium]